MLVKQSIDSALMSIRVSFISTSHSKFTIENRSVGIFSGEFQAMNIASGVSRVQIDCWFLADECFMFTSSDGFTGRF